MLCSRCLLCFPLLERKLFAQAKEKLALDTECAEPTTSALATVTSKELTAPSENALLALLGPMLRLLETEALPVIPITTLNAEERENVIALLGSAYATLPLKEKAAPEWAARTTALATEYANISTSSTLVTQVGMQTRFKFASATLDTKDTIAALAYAGLVMIR